MSIDHADFDYVCSLIRERAAIVLEEGKEYLVEARLTPIVREEGIDSIAELVARLRASPFNHLHTRVVEAMTTNETSWFRDIHPFEALKNVILPELMKRRAAGRTLHIWCGACSSGQEPYSIAMTICENIPNLADWNVQILATDISGEMLERTRMGCYSQLEINRGLPAPLLVKYFQKNGLDWQFREETRKMVETREMNLASVWPALPTMDIIFMRNVLIYFDVEMKKMILGKLRQVLKPDGYLFLGGAESTFHLDDSFVRAQLGKTTCFKLSKQ